MTKQEKALQDAKKVFGKSAFTEHTVNYFRIGYKSGGKVIMAIGDSWTEAMGNLLVLDNKRKA